VFPVTRSHSSATIRVGIIEDEPVMREGLALLINDPPEYECAGAWASMEEALADIKAVKPDVVLADIGLPGMSGIEGTRILAQQHPGIRVLMLTVYNDDDRIFAAMCAGACGYLLKNTPPARLLESLREVAAGGAVMSPSIARRVVELFRQFRPPDHAEYGLSPQESRLLKLLGEGHHYKTAAAELGISIHTVNFHLKRIYEKLQVHSKAEAVAKALREGLIR
jgi:DNA-binding NarL/FixJ family response regulator